MSRTLDQFARVLRGLWNWLRGISEDAAYDRYRRRAHPQCPALTPAEFYLRHIDHKYSRPCRCC